MSIVLFVKTKNTLPNLPILRKGFYDATGNFVCTGSYMGRTDQVPFYKDQKWKLHLVKLDLVGDYDKGGVYWGNTGTPIYRAVSANREVEMYFRHYDRNTVKRLVRETLPNVTFYR